MKTERDKIIEVLEYKWLLPKSDAEELTDQILAIQQEGAKERIKKAQDSLWVGSVTLWSSNQTKRINEAIHIAAGLDEPTK